LGSANTQCLPVRSLEQEGKADGVVIYTDEGLGTLKGFYKKTKKEEWELKKWKHSKK